MKTGLKIYKDTAGDWRWRIVSRNGRIIAASTEGYRRKRSAIANLKGILQALRNFESENKNFNNN
jgi:uncharacterized protein YegP (UPF0339 family)